MSSAARTEGFLKTPSGELYTQAWRPQEACRAAVVLVHGIGEHSGRYSRLGEDLALRGFSLHAFDLPGHGKSSGKRGHLGPFDRVFESIRLVIDDASRKEGLRIPVLLGHSLGGLISAWYAAAFPQTIQALALSSPLWGIDVPVPVWKQLIARSLAPLWPSLTLARPRRSGQALSHDPDVQRRYNADPLVHFRASAGLYVELTDRIRRLPEALEKLSMPALILQAGADTIASVDAVRRHAARLRQDQLKLVVFEGWYHEVFNEIGREAAVDALLSWLDSLPGEAGR